MEVREILVVLSGLIVIYPVTRVSSTLQYLKKNLMLKQKPESQLVVIFINAWRFAY